MAEYESGGFFAAISADVLYDKSLSSTAKLLFARIVQLARKTGDCFAGNAFLGEPFGLTDSSVSKIVKSLKEKNYIVIKYDYIPGKKEIASRHIFPVLTPKAARNIMPQPEPAGTEPCQEMPDTAPGTAPAAPTDGKPSEVVENFTPRGGKNDKDNIININNIKAAAPVEKQNEVAEAVAVSKNIQDLKAALAEIDPRLIFDACFYPKAAAYLARNSLPGGYLEWLYDFCLKKQPKDITAFYYSVFFAGDLSGQFQAQARPPVATVIIKCPCCGTGHDEKDDCPLCDLSAGSLNNGAKIKKHKRIFELPENIHEEYKKKESAILEGGQDFPARFAAFKELYREYGLDDP